MAGRKRRSSESSVEPPRVNKGKIKWLSERKVSRSRDPSEILVLKDVIIYRQDPNTMVNPLYLTQEGSCHIRGQLEAPDTEEDIKEQENYLLHPRFRDAYIEIRNSRAFAIGTVDDGQPVLWMLGERGYYEIKPSPEYEAFYNDICEAISLYFGILTAYETERAHLQEADPDVIAESMAAAKKTSKKSSAKAQPILETKLKRTKLARIFWLYAREKCDGVLLSDIEALCHRFAPFLIHHLDIEETFDWQGTEFHSWIRDTHPDVVKELDKAQKQILSGLPLATSASQQADETHGQSSSPQSTMYEDVEMKDATPLSQQLRVEPLGGLNDKAKSPSALATPSVSHMQNSPITKHMSPVEKLLQVFEEIGAEYQDLGKPTAQAVLNKLYFKCKITHYGTHSEIVAYYSSELLDRLNPRWHGTPFWNWLVTESQKPNKTLVHSTVESIPYQLERRRKLADTPPVSKSATSKKVASRNQSEDTRVSDQTRHQGKRPDDVYAGTGGLRPPGSASKRSFSELDDESASGTTRGRRSARRSMATANHKPDEFMEMDIDDAKNDVEDAGLQAEALELDMVVDTAVQSDHGFLTPLPEDAVPIVFNAFREPATRPTGPNDTWVCEQALCGFVVRDAEVEAGLEKIRRHFRDHEHEAERLELARAEALRGHQSINHLLDKIQAKGRRPLEAEMPSGGDGKTVAPVMRRLMV